MIEDLFLKYGRNVQVVISLADLKELFNQWQDERDSRKPEPEKDKIVSKEEAMEQLGITDVTLWRWGKMGYLKPIKVGRKVHYWQSQIDKLLEENPEGK